MLKFVTILIEFCIERKKKIHENKQMYAIQHKVPLKMNNTDGNVKHIIIILITNSTLQS